MSPPPPPISLGKPSLRCRLESYYSLIAPDAIADNDKWKQNFDIIYDKYGGTVEGETKLAAKLAKKYGSQIRLLVAPPHRQKQQELRTDVYRAGDCSWRGRGGGRGLVQAGCGNRRG